MPEVHSFKKYDIRLDRHIISKAKATRETIAAFNAEVIEGTAEEVAAEQLDGNGLYHGADHA